MNKDFVLLDEQSTKDMQSYLVRAKRLDPDGLVRLRAFGNVLAAYVAPIFSGSILDGGPTVIGLRTSELALDAEVDTLVPIAAVLARAGIQEVADTLPASVGGPIAARIRGEIWGRGIQRDVRIPTGAAFVAAGLGFMVENEDVGVYFAEKWVRLSSDFGHVIAREASAVI